MPVQRIALIACVAATLQAQSNQVSFDKDVKPVLEARCLKCHGPKMQLGKLDLRTRESALAGGEHGPAFIAGDPEQSRLYRHISGLEKPLMPMDGKLAEAEIGILKRWISQGAVWEGTLPKWSDRRSPIPKTAKSSRKHASFGASNSPPCMYRRKRLSRMGCASSRCFPLSLDEGQVIEPAPLAGKTTWCGALT